MDRAAYVYILTNGTRGTLYVGVTNNLQRRVWEHQQALVEGFTKKYGLKKLVYYEVHSTVMDAIRREKAMKAWKRQWKIDAIEKENPLWDDLSETLHR